MIAGRDWLIAKCGYEVSIVSTAVLDVSLHESLSSADHHLVNLSAHHDEDGRRGLPALVWSDTCESRQPQLFQTVEVIRQSTASV